MWHDIAVMYAGEIIEKGTAKEIIFDPLHPYSKALMNSIIVPEKGLKGHKLSVIPGSPPNLKEVQNGCRFADRCNYSTSACYERNITENWVGNRMVKCRYEFIVNKEMDTHEQ